MKVTADNFEEVFKPQTNHLDSNASFDGCMFETYGKELDYIFNLPKTTKRVWTIVEGDNDTLFYSAGFHYVNRIGFLVCEVEYEDGQEDIQLDCDF